MVGALLFTGEGGGSWGRKGGKRIDPDGAWLTADEAVTRDESSRDETRRDETRRDETRRDETRRDDTAGRNERTDERTNIRTDERRRPHSDLPFSPGDSWRVTATGWMKRRTVVVDLP